MNTKSDHPVLINCDMGEWDAPHLSYIDDKLMPLIHLTNIACGGHAGSSTLIKHTLTLAKKHGTIVGAHPGYQDRIGFGRQYISLNSNDLKEMLTMQIDLFLECCDRVDITPNHIKPHGALYHASNHHHHEADVIVDLISSSYSFLKLIVTPHSLLDRLADEAQIDILRESFVDRKYQDDLRLTPRSRDGAVLTSSDEAAAQYHLIQQSKIKTESGKLQNLTSDTCCIHGDNPAALDILKNLLNA